MTESKHTPGPWRANGHYVEAGELTTICTTDRWNEAIEPYGVESDLEENANAQLIAAAPELYEAADEALNVLIGCVIPAGGVDDRKALLDCQAMLRAALSRATGARP